MILLCFPENGHGAPIMDRATPKKCVFRGQPVSSYIFSEGVCRIWQGFSVFGQPNGTCIAPQLDFSFSSQGQGHKVTNLENVKKKINKLGIELLGFSTVSNESWYASSALRVLQLSSFTFFPIPASLPVASPRRSKNKKRRTVYIAREPSPSPDLYILYLYIAVDLWSQGY